MLTVHTQIVTDEASRPIAVVIPYREWLEFEQRLEIRPEAAVDLNDLAGSLPPGEDALAYQHRVREEWP